MLRRLALATLALTLSACLPEETEEEPTPTNLCTATYQGPGAEGTTKCGLIYNQRCKDDNASTANANCAYGMTAAEAAACPYCP